MSGGGLEEDKFLRMFLRSEDDLRAYARALLPTWEAVDEVMQEASVVMWRKLDQLRQESEFLPWAKVILRFEALKARRTAARDRLHFSNELIERLAEDDGDPGVEVLERERVALEACLGELDSEQQELLLMPYRSHGAVLELAERRGRTVNSLYKKIGRLRQKLMRCVEGRLAESNLEGAL